MSVTLVLGGARSGKSRYAESLLRDHPVVSYVAPGAVPDGSDPEWTERISRHQARRPAHWSTLETARLAEVIRAASHPLLIDCLGTWLTRLVDDIDAWDDRGRAGSHLEGATARLVDALASARVDVVLVSNEVGSSVVPSTASGRMFRDDLGRLNAAVSAASDHVFLVVAGRVLDLSACPLVSSDSPSVPSAPSLPSDWPSVPSDSLSVPPDWPSVPPDSPVASRDSPMAPPGRPVAPPDSPVAPTARPAGD